MLLIRILKVALEPEVAEIRQLVYVLYLRCLLWKALEIFFNADIDVVNVIDIVVGPFVEILKIIVIAIYIIIFGVSFFEIIYSFIALVTAHIR
jgi:hypothetical protein